MQNPVIGIIGGKGRMGSLFANFLRNRGIKVLVSDKLTKLSNVDIAQKADIVIISVPISNTISVIQEVLPHLTKEQALMDFTSIKTPAVKAMLKGKCEVLGMHPMLGDSNPIPGQVIILTPTKKSGVLSKWMRDFLSSNGAKITEMTPREHDQAMALSQGIIHFADITFASALRESKKPISKILQYASVASELKVQLAARVIDQSPELYGCMQIYNPYNLKFFKKYQKTINRFLEIISKKDLQAFKKDFTASKKYFGPYSKEAFKDSTYLIDKFLTKNAKPQPQAHKSPGKNSLALLGPKNTYTDISANLWLKQNPKLKKYYAKDIEEVFELTEKGQVISGIVPIENKLHGTVRETLDQLFSSNVQIVDEISLPINHCLITLASAKKSDVKTIISHPQALSQCKKYLKKHFPNAELQGAASTTAAVEKLIESRDPQIAAIAPEAASQTSQLKILAKKIQDEKDNSTTFIVISPRGKNSAQALTTSSTANAVHNKTSIAFHFSADSPGSLFTVFKDFADAKINMTKIESRPTKARFGDYIFYLDFEGTTKDPKVAKTLKKVTSKVAKLKILGSY